MAKSAPSSKSKVQRKSKRCSKCRQDKELSEFYRQPYRSDGHGYKCKDCSCQYNAERRKRPCGISGCVRPHRSQGYCYFHWRQLREHGKILHRSGSLFDRNVIEQEGPIAYIHVIRENGGLLDKAIVDVADIPIVKNHKWHRDSSVGVSAIYKVHDQDLKRTSVLKIILPGVMKDTLLFRRFIEEAQITGQLEHPNIIPVHELGALGQDQLYFSMKLVQGESLGTILENTRDCDEAYVEKYSRFVLLTIFRKVCDAVAYAHSKQIIHRDIKPDNIMVGDYGEVLLMDWGLARRERRGIGEDDESADRPGKAIDKADDELKTQYGVVKGTPVYMAPEQAKGQVNEIDHRSDIFLLGSTLYTMATFQVPFTGSDIYDILANAGNGNFIDPGVRAPGRQIPEELCRIIMKAMAYNKEDRYQAVEELSEDIDALLEGNMGSIHKEFEADEYLMKEGESGHEAYLIVSGKVEVYKTMGGNPVKLITLSDGDVLGEMALILGAPRSASVKALEQTDVVVITEETMKQGLNKLPPWMGKTVDSLAERLRSANATVHPLINGDCTYHVLNQLQLVYRAWGTPVTSPEGGRTVISLDTDKTVREIATNLTISKERVMLVISHLLDIKLFSPHGEDKIFIPDINLFSNLVEHSRKQSQMGHGFDNTPATYYSYEGNLVVHNAPSEASNLSPEFKKVSADPNHHLRETDDSELTDAQLDTIVNTLRDTLVNAYPASA